MTTTAKFILGFSLACIVLSFTAVGGHVYYGILRPVGAVAFIVFYLVNMLGKEMRKFDEDHLNPTRSAKNSLKGGDNAGRKVQLIASHCQNSFKMSPSRLKRKCPHIKFFSFPHQAAAAVGKP